MKAVAISVGASFLVVGTIVAAAITATRAGGSSPSADLVALRDEIGALREDVRGLVDELRESRESERDLARAAAAARLMATESEDAEGDGEPVDAAAAPGDLTESVALVIAEERRQQEERRDQEREERRQRFEERRQELESMREGPYDRYNLKVNSLAKLLEMTDAQKQSYFDLISGYQAKAEEGMKQLREAREAQQAAAGEGGEEGQERGRGRGGRGFERGQGFRELYEGLQQGFAADMQTILTPAQFETFGELSRSAQSFQGTDMVTAGGGDGRFGGGGGPTRGGGFTFGGGGGGGRGGSGGGRGGGRGR